MSPRTEGISNALTMRYGGTIVRCTLEPGGYSLIQEPVQPTIAPAPPTRPARGGRYRGGVIGLLIVGCLVLAVAVVGAIAASSAGTPTSAVGASAAPEASAKTSVKPDAEGNGHGPKFNNGHGPDGLKGPKGNGHVGRGAITITAIDGSKVSLATEDGWTRTIEVGSNTVIMKGGQKIGVADLNVKDIIAFHQQRNADGSYTVDAIGVILPSLGGQVSAKTGDTITLKRADGTTATVHVSGKTTYHVKGKATAALTDIGVGDRVSAEGTLRADGSLDAVSVEGKAAKDKGPKASDGVDGDEHAAASPSAS